MKKKYQYIFTKYFVLHEQLMNNSKLALSNTITPNHKACSGEAFATNGRTRHMDKPRQAFWELGCCYTKNRVL